MANPPNTTSPQLQLSDTAALEAFIPGYSFITRLLLYFHVDPSTYVPYVLTTGVVAAALRYVLHRITRLLREYFVSTAEIRVDDEVYSYVMFWLARQDFVGRSKHVIAQTRTGAGRWDEDDNSDEDEDVDEDGEGESISKGESDLLADFDDYWARALSRDKYRPLRFTPAEGTHYFRFRGRFLSFSRAVEERGMYTVRTERLYLSCLGRDPTILKELLSEAQRAYVEKDGTRTVIYRGQKQGSYYDWARCMARAPRPLSTVVLDEGQKQAFVADLKEYLHPRTRRWYSNRGIPYRRGYLLHGPPGTGKTSLCSAAAGLLGLKLYLLSLNSGSLDEDGLMELFHELPQRCIVLLEDVDSAGVTQKRDDCGSSSASSAGTPSWEKVESSETEEAKSKGISLSALLNVIDGVAATEGRILVMTTNHADKLDPALLRPGRVDMSIEFGYADKADVQELFSAIYTSLEGDLPRSSKPNGAVGKEKREESGKDRESVLPLAKEFASRVPAGELTAADIQGYLLTHKGQPEEALDGVEEWVKSVREKRGNQGDIK